MKNPNYNLISQEEELNLLWLVLQNEGVDLLSFDGFVGAFYDDFEDELSTVESSEVEEFISSEILRFGKSILSFSAIYELFRDHFNNEVLDEWVLRNPLKAYSIDVKEIQTNPFALSISDDDHCSDCAFLAYVPGELSLCAKASSKDWPCEFDDDGESVSCDEHEECIDTNTVP